MSIINRFSKRSNTPLVLEFDWPLDTKDFKFRCSRFAQAEHNEAHLDADGQLVRRGIKADSEDRQQHYLQAFYYELSKYVKRHVKGWTHNAKEGDPIEYSQGALEELFNSMTINERTGFGMSYWVAEQALLEEKKS